MAFLNNIDIVNGHRFSERKVMLYQLYVLYDTITVGYWKAISVKNCIFNKGQIDIFVFFTLNITVNTIWFVYSEYLYFTFQLNHYEWLTNTLLISCNILVYVLWQMSIIVSIAFSVSQKSYTKSLSQIYFVKYCFTVSTIAVCHY